MNKTLESVLGIIDHYLADRRGIVVGQHYLLSELMLSKDFVTAQKRSSGATFRYNIGKDRYRVELHKGVNEYYQCIEVQKMGTKVDGIEVRL